MLALIRNPGPATLSTSIIREVSPNERFPLINEVGDPTNTETQGPDQRRLDAVVEVTEPTGPDVLAVMMLGGVEATARLHADTKARPGEMSTFLVDMAKVCLFDPRTERRIV